MIPGYAAFKPFKRRFSASQGSLIVEPVPYEGSREQGSDLDSWFRQEVRQELRP